MYMESDCRLGLFKSRLGSLLLLVICVVGLWFPKTVHAQTAVTLTVVSEPGDPWFSWFEQRGPAVLTFGHAGCLGVDTNGFCVGGSWPTIAGAHWIWKSQLVTPVQAIYGTPVVAFAKSFTVPVSATNVTGQIQVNADNVYVLYLNGVIVGSDGNVGAVETYAIKPALGTNTIVLAAYSLPSGPGATPYTNPAGVIYRAQVSFLQGY